MAGVPLGRNRDLRGTRRIECRSRRETKPSSRRPIPGNGSITGSVFGLTLLAVLASACAPVSVPAIQTASPSAPGALPAPTKTAFSPPEASSPPPASAWRVTEPGCCSRPWWSDDGSRVVFVDNPPGEAPLGLYSVPVQGGPADLVSPLLSADDVSSLHPQNVWTGPGDFPVPGNAGSVRLAPAGDRVAWTQGGDIVANLDVRQRSIWTAARGDVSGRNLGVVQGGGLVGWTGDGDGLILTGRFGPSQSGLWRLPLDGGSPVLLLEANRPRSVTISPDGEWSALFLAFEDDKGRNGAWIVSTSGAAQWPLALLASYRWLADGRLIYIPFDPVSDGLTLMEFDPSSGVSAALLEEIAFPGGIAAGVWEPSPDGRWVVYRSAADGGLWVQRIPG